MPARSKIPTRILLMPNAAIPKAVQMAALIDQFLSQRGVDHQVFTYAYEQPEQTPDLSGWDLLIVVGGDGTLLRAGHLCAPLGLPLLGVQAGKLSFLVELTDNDWAEKLDQLLLGEYHTESRMMLTAQHYHQGRLAAEWDVINEVVIARGREVRPIEIRVDVNEGYLTSYIADGLIVATSTGSTAYALAVGGPILPPELRNMLVIPIAPHLSLDRAVILAEGATVTLHAKCDHEAVISVDGTAPVTLAHGDYVRVATNTHSLHMLRFGAPNYFYRSLAAVLQHNPILKSKQHD